MIEEITKILMLCVEHGYSMSLAGVGTRSDYTNLYVENKAKEIIKIIEENKK